MPTRTTLPSAQPRARSAAASTRSAWLVAAADCLLLALIALALRLPCLGCQSLWIDELFSVHWSQLDLPFLFGAGARIETNPPTYYVLLHAWMAAFGSGEVAVRLPSVLASAATAPIVYGISRRIAGRTAGLLAGLFFALNPVSVAFAQEARGYALSALLAALALAALVRCQERGQPAPPARPLVGFVLASVAAGWVHYTALFLVAAGFGAVGLRLVATRPFPWRAAGVWCGAAALTAAALAPAVLLAAALSGSNNLVWIEPLSPRSVLDFVFDLALAVPRTGAWFPLASVLLALLALIIAASWSRLRALDSPFLVLALAPCLYFALLVLVSAVRPMLLVRVATWMVIPLCIVLALAAVVQPNRSRRAAICLWPLLVFPAGLASHLLLDRKEDWREAARLIDTDARCGGPVLIGEFNALGVLQYGLYGRRPVLVFLPDPRRRDSVEFRLSKRLMHLPELDPGAVPDFIVAHPGAAVLMRDETVGFLPAPMRALLDRAPFRARPDGLALACF